MFCGIGVCAPCIKHFLMSVSSFLTLLLKSWVFELKCKIYFAKEFPVCFFKVERGLGNEGWKGRARENRNKNWKVAAAIKVIGLVRQRQAKGLYV